MKVAVSIVNFNTKELTLNCIKSVLGKKWKSEVEVWVVDNASKDGSVEEIKNLKAKNKQSLIFQNKQSLFFQNQNYNSKLKIIENRKNLGFGSGHNVALRKMKAPYVLILNSDTIMDEGTIDKMVEFMEENRECAIASCKVLGFDGKLQPNAGDLPFIQAVFNWLFNLEIFGIKRPMLHINDPDFYKRAGEVGWVSGNFMMIRVKALKEFGLFDEHYFMYFEDVDLCFRANKKGFKVMINPEVYIKHLGGGSLDEPHFRQWLGEFHGLSLFYRSRFGRVHGSLVVFLIYLSTLMRIIAFSLTGNFSYAKTYAKVIREF